MRKFKFRIWHKKENRWLDPWAEEDPIISLKDFGYGCNVYLYDRKINGFTDLHCQMEDLVIQQFTGLQDIDGNDIYEGDILKSLTINDIVEYKNGAFYADLPLHKVNGIAKIAGNIFEGEHEYNDS